MMVLARRVLARRLARTAGRCNSNGVAFTVELEDDTVQTLVVPCGTTLLEALDGADFSDQWEGGQCGGGCACSTCRVVVSADGPWRTVMEPPRDDELDILEDGADQAAAAARREFAEAATEDGGCVAAAAAVAEGGRAAGVAAAAAYLDGSRLSCQLELCAALDGMVVRVPESMYNLIEIPLHMRPR